MAHHVSRNVSRDALRAELGLLPGVRGRCPDCAEPLAPVDQDGLEWCCVQCCAAFATWHGSTAPAGSRAPSEVA